MIDFNHILLINSSCDSAILQLDFLAWVAIILILQINDVSRSGQAHLQVRPSSRPLQSHQAQKPAGQFR